MDTRIPSDGNRRVEPIVRAQPPTFHTHQGGNDTGNEPKEVTIEVPDEESRKVVEALLKMTPVEAATILLNSDDRRRDYICFLPPATRRAIVRELPTAATQSGIRQLQEQAIRRGPIDNVVRTIIGTAADIEANVRGIIERRLTEEAERNASKAPGKREWLA